ncbi:hypothetical protein [Geoalkalibacter halelectricus]|uniref:Uncharacterized protein n=1 Tax=Geoalkalibacter halelectricus TaxID=2847045 RepID=A0ABY5ZMY0_9BACT|nr:hypothetical protein [Geoalkalibacter halelectricus]MDO3377801.1 hypothetical protein [Geoalkalibacter halelectricus]UWZ78606.1 hypothetical protein L9S41_13070 [Geoalkalibacter halelectricus]
MPNPLSLPKALRFLPFFLFLMPAAVTSAQAMTSTITCHCFQDRSYDPDSPAAADAYFLASAQNTLLAAVFERSKREVVMAKQTGTSNEDLWIAYRAAALSSLEPRALLQERRRAAHWSQVLEKHAIDLAIPPVEAGDGWDEVLARAVIDQVLLEQGLADAATLRALHEAGCDPQQTILAVFIAQAGGRPATAVYFQAREGNRPWGQLLAEAGLADNLGTVVQQRVDPTRNPPAGKF